MRPSRAHVQPDRWDGVGEACHEHQTQPTSIATVPVGGQSGSARANNSTRTTRTAVPQEHLPFNFLKKGRPHQLSARTLEFMQSWMETHEQASYQATVDMYADQRDLVPFVEPFKQIRRWVTNFQYRRTENFQKTQAKYQANKPRQKTEEELRVNRDRVRAFRNRVKFAKQAQNLFGFKRSETTSDTTMTRAASRALLPVPTATLQHHETSVPPPLSHIMQSQPESLGASYQVDSSTDTFVPPPPPTDSIFSPVDDSMPPLLPDDMEWPSTSQDNVDVLNGLEWFDRSGMNDLDMDCSRISFTSH